MGDIIEQNGTVESSEESLTQSYSYVLHGASAYCECGSRLARLTLPNCHGTYMHDMPVMTVEDCEAKTNVKAFGFCSSLTNPDRLKAVQKVMEIVEGDKNILDGVMDGISAVGKGITSIGKKVAGVFGYEEDTTQDPYHGYGKDVYESVTVLCNPEFAIGDSWSGGTDRLQINGVNALNINCTLVCLKSDKGPIHLADDGQENAATEQHGSADMANWKQGDPIPDATQGNLEKLNENIEELKAQKETTADENERRRLEEEIESKEQLSEQMESTISMVNEIKTGLVCGAYDETTIQKAYDDMNTIQESFKNGTPCVTVSEESQNEILNGAYQTHMDGGNVSAYLSENTDTIPYESFNGTMVNSENADKVEYIYNNGRLMSRNEYNQSVSDYVDYLVNENNS